LRPPFPPSPFASSNPAMPCVWRFYHQRNFFPPFPLAPLSRPFCPVCSLFFFQRSTLRPQLFFPRSFNAPPRFDLGDRVHTAACTRPSSSMRICTSHPFFGRGTPRLLLCRIFSLCRVNPIPSGLPRFETPPVETFSCFYFSSLFPTGPTFFCSSP